MNGGFFLEWQKCSRIREWWRLPNLTNILRILFYVNCISKNKIKKTKQNQKALRKEHCFRAEVSGAVPLGGDHQICLPQAQSRGWGRHKMLQTTSRGHCLPEAILPISRTFFSNQIALALLRGDSQGRHFLTSPGQETSSLAQSWRHLRNCPCGMVIPSLSSLSVVVLMPGSASAE